MDGNRIRVHGLKRKSVGIRLALSKVGEPSALSHLLYCAMNAP